MKDFLVFLIAYLVSAIFNVGWLYLVTKYGLMKWFVRDLFIEDDGKIVLGVKQMMVAPFFSFFVKIDLIFWISNNSINSSNSAFDERTKNTS